MQQGQHLLFMPFSYPSTFDDLSGFYTTRTPESPSFCISSQNSQELNIKLSNAQKILVFAMVPTALVDP